MGITIGPGITIGGGVGFSIPASGSSRGALSFSRSGQTDLQVLYSSNQSHPAPPARQDTYTGDITIEMWIKPTATNTGGVLWWVPTGWANNNGVISYNAFQLSIDGAGLMTLNNVSYSDGTPGNGRYNIMGYATVNAWNHVCVSVVSGRVKLYINGALKGSGYTDEWTTTDPSTGNSIFNYSEDDYVYMPSFFIGKPVVTENTGAYYDGLITNFRVSNSDIYSLASTPSTFTVPSTVLTATSGVSLILMTMSSSATALDETSGNAGGTTVIEYNPPTWVSTTPF
jgi:hypothetical protein